MNITSNLPVSQANITYIAVNDEDPDNIWVTMGGYNNLGVFESTNGGLSWINISDGLPQIPVMCIVQNELNNDETELYAGTDVGVYVRVDDDDWTLFSSGLPM